MRKDIVQSVKLSKSKILTNIIIEHLMKCTFLVALMFFYNNELFPKRI